MARARQEDPLLVELQFREGRAADEAAGIRADSKLGGGGCCREPDKGVPIQIEFCFHSFDKALPSLADTFNKIQANEIIREKISFLVLYYERSRHCQQKLYTGW